MSDPLGNSDLQRNFFNVPLRRDDASSYPWGADHLQGHRVTFNFPDVAIDLVGGETYVLTLLLIRHIRQDQSLPRPAFQRHAAVREYLCPSAHAWSHIGNLQIKDFQMPQEKYTRSTER